MKKQKEDIQILLFAYDLIPQDIVVEQITNIEVNKKECISIRTLKASARFPINKLNQFNELQALFKQVIDNSVQYTEMQKEFNNLLNTLTPAYQDGDEFQGIKGIEQLVSDGQQAYLTDCQYQPTYGQVTLINFWIAKKYIIDPMIYHLEILEAYPEWKDYVRIVGISLDDDENNFEKVILENQWLNYEQYRIKGGYKANNSFLKPLNMSEIPYILLLNKKNQIVYRGNQANIILEEKIKELIDEDIQKNQKKQQVSNKKENKLKKQNEVILEKEQFKLIKKFARMDLFTSFNQLNDNVIQINVSAIKRNLIQRDGSKLTLARTPLKLSYEIDLEQKEKMDFFLKFIWETLPEAHRTLGQIVVNDQQSIKSAILMQIQDIGAKFGINLQFSKEITTNFKFNNFKNSFDQETNEELICKVENVNGDNFSEFDKDLTNFDISMSKQTIQERFIQQAITSIQYGLAFKINQKFDPISFYKFFQDSEIINHKEGQILILYHWFSYSGKWETQMSKNYKILNKYKEIWKDSVRFVALSAYIAIDSIQFIEKIEKYQNSIEFYFPKKQCTLSQYYFNFSYFNGRSSKNSYPVYVIIDKFGRIRYKEHEIRLSGIIDELLAEQEIKQMQDTKILDLNKESLTQLCNFLNSQQISQFTKYLGRENIFDFNIYIQQQSNIKGNTTKLAIQYFVRQKNFEKFNIFLDKVLSFVPKNSYEIKGQISKTIDIPFPGKECVLCKNALDDQVQQYYSPYKNEFLCCECAEYDDETQINILNELNIIEIFCFNSLNIIRAVKNEQIIHLLDQIVQRVLFLSMQTIKFLYFLILNIQSQKTKKQINHQQIFILFYYNISIYMLYFFSIERVISNYINLFHQCVEQRQISYCNFSFLFCLDSKFIYIINNNNLTPP